MNEAEWKLNQEIIKHKDIAKKWKDKHYVMRTYRDVLVGVILVQAVLDVVLLVMVFRLLAKLYG